jgi:hypothetical protein
MPPTAQQKADQRWAAHDFWVGVADAIMEGEIPLHLAVQLEGADSRAKWALLGLLSDGGLPDALEALIAVTKLLPRRAIPIIVELTGAPSHPYDLEREVYAASSEEPTALTPTWLHGIDDIDVRERLLVRRMKSIGPPTSAEVVEAAAMSQEEIEQLVAGWPR